MDDSQNLNNGDIRNLNIESNTWAYAVGPILGSINEAIFGYSHPRTRHVHIETLQSIPQGSVTVNDHLRSHNEKRRRLVQSRIPHLYRALTLLFSLFLAFLLSGYAYMFLFKPSMDIDRVRGDGFVNIFSNQTWLGHVETALLFRTASRLNLQLEKKESHPTPKWPVSFFYGSFPDKSRSDRLNITAAKLSGKTLITINAIDFKTSRSIPIGTMCAIISNHHGAD